MTNLPKELKEIRDKSAEEFAPLAEFKYGDLYTTARISHKRGFDACYEAMLKTHVPREKVEKLLEALRRIGSANVFAEDAQFIAIQALKDFYGQ